MSVKLALQLDKVLEAGPNLVFYADSTLKGLKTTILSKTHTVSIELDKDNIFETAGFLKSSIFEDGVSLIGWDFKKFFSFHRFHCGNNFTFDAKLLDLKIAENFLGIKKDVPADFNELKSRLMMVLGHPSWSSFRGLHQTIYQPLFSLVLPNIESEGVFDVIQRKVIYPSYEIEGSVNGRLSCCKEFGFNPHSMSEEERRNCVPKYNDSCFVYLDYSNMEVAMLGWLSKDERLVKILSETDFYKALFKLLSGNEAETETQREFCKNIFLPVVFGQSAESLSQELSLSVDVGRKIVGRLHKLFPKCFGWVEDYKVDGIYKDYVGRCRTFELGKEYKYRNFIIQAPSALFCLEKLVCLFNDLSIYGNIVAHIHDGYLVRVEQKRVIEMETLAKMSLESESVIFPGLHLRINSKISKTFA
jgi:hypothetical protein